MPDKYFFDPVNPDANVTIYIGGLAISNYNTKKEVWETVFLRHVQDHLLKLYVFRFVDGVADKDFPATPIDIRQDEKISIKAGNARDVSAALRTRGFNYQPFTDKRDLGWCIDFASDRMHGKRKIKLKKGKPVTCLTIENSTFYAARHAEGKYDIKGVSTFVGHWIGADIEVIDGTLKIDFSIDSEKNLQLPCGENIKYMIVFNNACDDDDNRCLSTNDFKYYYDLLAEDEIKVIPPPVLMNKISQGQRKATKKILRTVLGKLVACECTVCSQIDGNSLFDLA